MKIAIVSDTHGNVANFGKAVQWIKKQNIKTIFHCGDIGSPESFEESFEGFEGEFFGVLGNMDRDYKILIEEYNRIFGVKVREHIFEAEVASKRVAVTHFPTEAKKLAQSGKFDLVFYGHTHRAWEEKISLPSGKQCYMINPGELAGHFYKPTFAVYDTDTDKLELKILEKL